MKSTPIWTAIALLLAATAAPRSAAADTQAQAGQLFEKNCANCHGKDGRAKTFRAKFNKARDLTDAQWQDAITDAAITESIKAGRGKMPPYANVLTESQIALLSQYVRSLKQPGSPPPAS